MKSMALTRGGVCVVIAMASLATAACSSGREVEVTGAVSAPASLTLDAKIHVDFVDVIADGEEEVAHTISLDAPGSFSEKVSLEGDTVVVRAILDKNGDGACSAGEAWASAEAAIAEDDTVEPVSLTLEMKACPAAE
jgi:hypothetical protein